MPKSEKTVQPEFTLDESRMPEDPNPTAAEADGDGDGGEKKAAVKDPAVTELQHQLDELRRMNTATLASLAARPVTVVQPAGEGGSANAAPSIDFEGLPDPTVDREGFLKGATQRMQTAVAGAASKVIEDARQVAARQTANADKINGLWAEFQEKYEDLGEFTDLVQVAAERTARKLQSRGLNVETYIDTNRDGFLEDIATDVRKTVNKIKGLDENGNTQGGDDDEGRAVVAGGNSGGTSRGTKKPGGEKPSLFVNELKSIQKELGIF